MQSTRLVQESVPPAPYARRREPKGRSPSRPSSPTSSSTTSTRTRLSSIACSAECAESAVPQLKMVRCSGSACEPHAGAREDAFELECTSPRLRRPLPPSHPAARGRTPGAKNISGSEVLHLAPQGAPEAGHREVRRRVDQGRVLRHREEVGGEERAKRRRGSRSTASPGSSIDPFSLNHLGHCLLVFHLLVFRRPALSESSPRLTVARFVRPTCSQQCAAPRAARPFRSR